jgi:hypothetical protein
VALIRPSRVRALPPPPWSRVNRSVGAFGEVAAFGCDEPFVVSLDLDRAGRRMKAEGLGQPAAASSPFTNPGTSSAIERPKALSWVLSPATASQTGGPSRGVA